jgi:hypothetical protein
MVCDCVLYWYSADMKESIPKGNPRARIHKTFSKNAELLTSLNI